MHLILAVAPDPVVADTNPVVRWLMVFASGLGVIIAVRGLRRIPSWILLMSGTKAAATVTKVEIRGSNGERRPMRRPFVAFTTADGRQVTTSPAFYRPRCAKAAGEAVEVRYDARKPERVAVGGFDFQARELVPVAAGILLTVVSVSWSFGH